jgi:hypothetical protein
MSNSLADASIKPLGAPVIADISCVFPNLPQSGVYQCADSDAESVQVAAAASFEFS